MSTPKRKLKSKLAFAEWHAVMDLVFRLEHEINMPFGYKRDIFYRGQADFRWPLMPSIARSKVTDLGLLENNFYADFCTHGANYLSKDLRPLEILAYMQHYGLPTRLLDWSTNLLSALFFAVEGC